MKDANDRRFWMGIAMGALIAVGLIIAPHLVSGVAIAQDSSGGTAKAVVLVRCKAASHEFSVVAYQGSVATPARKTESCADTLGDLVKAGFEIDQVGYNDDADLVVFTVTR